MESNPKNSAEKPKKRKNQSSGEVLPKKYKRLSIADKLEIISRSERGVPKAQIARDYGVNESVVRGIVKNRDKLEVMKGEANLEKDFKVRDGKIKETERLLMIWIEDNNVRRIPMSRGLIQAKAKSLYMKLDPSTEANESCSKKFKASDQ